MRKVLNLYEKTILRGFIHSAGMLSAIGNVCRFDDSDCDIKELHFYKNDIEITDYIISENAEERSETKVIIHEKEKSVYLYSQPIPVMDRKRGMHTCIFLFQMKK